MRSKMESWSVSAHSVTGVDAATSWLTTATGMPAETAGTPSSRNRKSKSLPFILDIFIYSMFSALRCT